MAYRIAAVGTVLILSLTAVNPVWADRGHEGRGDHFRGRETPYHERGYVLDNRYHHDRYYPPRGFKVGRLPREHHVVPYHGVHYYFSAGIWYRPFGPRFEVVIPPVGLAISILPPYYTTVWVLGTPYYYAAGVYYVWNPSQRGYVVTSAPSESDVATTPPATAEQLFIYPKNGQSEQKLASDRYECHRWAVGQTGFDPTQPPVGLPDSEFNAERGDYNRAMTACLEGRGYTVK